MPFLSFACEKGGSRVRGKACARGDGPCPTLSRADVVLTHTCENLLGLCVLPDGPGHPVASSGSGLEPGEQGSGDRI